jgi:D-sedoheptulose 7-phosphate isomerase
LNAQKGGARLSDVDCTLPLKNLISEYVEQLIHFLDGPPINSIIRVAHILSTARDQSATIYVAGNGGSASTASHWVNDLGKATKKRTDKAPVRVVCLSDNLSWLTALANDEGYDRVFAGQLENFAKPGDLLVVISASGNSPNLVRAVELAKSRGMLTVALLGFDGGTLMKMVDECILIPSKKGDYGFVESGHSMLCHILAACLNAPWFEQQTGMVYEVESRAK